MFVAPMPRKLECLDVWSHLVSEMALGDDKVYVIRARYAWVLDESLRESWEGLTYPKLRGPELC